MRARVKPQVGERKVKPSGGGPAESSWVSITMLTTGLVDQCAAGSTLGVKTVPRPIRVALTSRRARPLSRRDRMRGGASSGNVIVLEDEVPPVEAVRAPVRDDVARLPGIVLGRNGAESVRRAAAVDADDGVGHGHDSTVPPRTSGAPSPTGPPSGPVGRGRTVTVTSVRVIAGKLRGRRLRSPDGRDVRPTSDRVREAMFNALTSRVDLHGTAVVDLFAGTGALGIEAWSRGAATVTFVERDRRTAALLRANLDDLGVDGGTVVVGDAAAWVARAPAAVDVALADPPYAFDGWDDLLDPLDARLVVAESDRPIEVPGWEAVRQATYGSTVVTMLRRG